MDMKITDVDGFTPLPGLSGERIAFDPDEDPLGLAPVSGQPREHQTFALPHHSCLTVPARALFKSCLPI